ncbi:MAG TPA: serine hydrolase domain-containing protein [Bacillota bacterium]|nr:serine hydrolase domain-containing protein [Bacillota bacterium]
MVAVFKSLDELLTNKCETAKIPGMALIVAKDGQPIFETYYGYRDMEKQLPVTRETVFGVASITKSFATLAIMQLADQGKLSVYDPVVKWLPEFQLVDKSLSNLVTIHHLMTHTSGLPGLPLVHQARAESIRQDPDGEYLFGDLPTLTDKKQLTVVDVLNLLQTYDYALLGKPGDMFNYSNESYAFLQEIIERASGESFIDYMNQYILQPLHMERATFLTEDLATMDNVTELYAFTQDESKDVFHSPAWWDVGGIYANGSLKASIVDLINYLEVYRLDGNVHGEQIVSKQSVDQMTITQTTTPHGIHYGYGLQIHNRFGKHLVGHGGGIKGVSSHMLVCAEAGLTVAVLTNIANVDAEDLAMTAMGHALQIEEEERIPDPVFVKKDELAKYVGTYESLEGDNIKVTADETKLTLHIGHDFVNAKPLGDHLFSLKDGKTIAFVTDDIGDIRGVYYSVRFLPKIA